MVFSDERGSVKTISVGKTWREVNLFTSKADAIRGGHYHKMTEEVLFVIEGKIEITCENTKNSDKETIIIGPNEGVQILPYEKHTAKIIEDTMWLAFLSKEYDNDDPDVFE